MEKEFVSKFIELVQNLIEQCIQQYMTPTEVVNTLQNKAKIEPELAQTFWRRLEEQNPEFFRSYYTRLAVMHQIEEYNRLLEKQKQLMDEEQTKVASTSNGFHSHAVSSLPYSNIPDFIENPYVYAPQTTEGLINGGMADMFAQGDIPTMPHIQNSNGRSSSSSGMVDMSVHEDIPVPECSSSSPHMFGSDVNVNEVSPNVGNASATPITSANSTLHSVNESVADRPFTYAIGKGWNHLMSELTPESD
ncbi:unnamed protein product [Trifolium pratense]|uniref:Uncharacterized protein n=1 Tax=Trifolium pratense TaxID=57577 RepID=A0ACB0KZH6_TRIPR|nr:unnamed protein product [Trifolium pratense]